MSLSVATLRRSALAVAAAGLLSACTGERPRLLAPVIRITSAGCLGLANEVGVGFAVGDDLVLTAAHVVRGTTRIELTIDAVGEPVLGVIEAIDIPNDLALVRFPPGGLTTWELADTKARTPAHVLLPRDKTPTRIDGRTGDLIIADFEEPADKTRYLRPMVRVELPIESGDSGAPLIDADGRVVGVMIADSRTTVDLSYAVSSEPIKAFMKLRPQASANGPESRCG